MPEPDPDSAKSPETPAGSSSAPEAPTPKPQETREERSPESENKSEAKPPLESSPSLDSLSSEKPAVEQPASDKPVQNQPIAEVKVSEATADDKATAGEKAPESPPTRNPATEEKASEKPATDKPVAEEKVPQKPAQDRPGTEEKPQQPAKPATPPVDVGAMVGKLGHSIQSGFRSGVVTVKETLEGMSSLMDDIVIGLGSDYVQIASREQPEPAAYGSFVAISKANGQLLALGQKARELYGREPHNIEVLPLLKHGLPENPDLFTKFLQKVFKKQFRIGNLVRPRLICSGNFYSPIMRTVCSEALFQIRSRDVLLCEPEIAAAVGMGIDILDPELHSVMLFERDWLGFTVISMTGSLAEVRLNIGFEDLVQDIHIYFEESKHFSPRRDDLLHQFGSHGFTGKQKLGGWEAFSGQLERGKSQSMEVEALEYQRAVSPTLLRIKYHVNRAIQKLNPEQRYIVQSSPTYMAGHYANLPGFKQLMERIFGREFLVPANPGRAMVEGLINLVPILDKLRSLNENEDPDFDF